MGNSLVIYSNTDIRFQEPEEIIESLIERLDNYPWNWTLIDDMYGLKGLYRLSVRSKKKWKIYPWRPHPDRTEETQWEYDIGTWDDESGSLDFYLNNDELGFSLYRQSARIKAETSSGSYYEFKFMRESVESLARFNKSRGIIKQVCRALGGDRVVYIGDQIKEHSKYEDMLWEGKKTFEEIEMLMLKELGPPEKTMLTVYDDKGYHNARYFIDRFEDLD
jgi:hypothetical protein